MSRIPVVVLLLALLPVTAEAQARVGPELPGTVSVDTASLRPLFTGEGEEGMGALIAVSVGVVVGYPEGKR